MKHKILKKIVELLGFKLVEKKLLKNQRLIATVMSNLGFEKAWIDRGGILERTAVGDKYVHQAMIEKKASLGGEQSGHILSTKNDLSGDGLLTALHLAKICQELNTTITDLFDQSFKPFPQKLVNIPLPQSPEERSWEDDKVLKEALNKAEESIGKNGRILVRKSGTEPILRVMFESNNPIMVESLSSHIERLAEEKLNVA